MKIAILGAGAFGTALGGILAEKGFDIDYYDSRLEKERLSDTLSGAKYVILCVPSKVVPFLLPYIPKSKPLIVATKGILSAKVFSDFPDYMVLSGPGFADDIKAQKQTKLTATDDRIIDLFSTNYLSFDKTKDIGGVLMCGALKNVYAIGAGMLGLEPNTKEHQKYLNDVAQEMKNILKNNGAQAKTVDLACGVGDLKITCDFPSRNYEFGQLLRHNPNSQPKKTVEGVSALKKIKRGEIKIPKNTIILHKLIKDSNKWV